MPKVKYVGPFEAVQVPAAGGVTVERGKSIDVDEAVARSLCQQKDNWERTSKPRKKAAKKSAAPKPATKADPAPSSDDAGDKAEEN